MEKCEKDDVKNEIITHMSHEKEIETHFVLVNFIFFENLKRSIYHKTNQKIHQACAKTAVKRHFTETSGRDGPIIEKINHTISNRHKYHRK